MEAIDQEVRCAAEANNNSPAAYGKMPISSFRVRKTRLLSGAFEEDARANDSDTYVRYWYRLIGLSRLASVDWYQSL